MDIRLTWTDSDEAGDYVVPNVLSPKDLVSGPDSIDKISLHTHTHTFLPLLLIQVGHLQLLAIYIVASGTNILIWFLSLIDVIPN